VTARVIRVDPARPDVVVGEVPAATPADVDRAVARADAAQRAWSKVPVADRCRALVDAVRSVDVQATAALMCRELGKVLPDCVGEVTFSRVFAEWVAERAPEVLTVHELDDDAGRLLLEPRPYGVVAAVTPWNAPVVLAMLKVAPAVAAGNAVVVKPSPLAPLAIDSVVRQLADRLPEGVLQVVHGGPEPSAALVADPRVAKVAFTGGGATAREVGVAAARTLTPTVLELGGNDPAIILDDAPLDDATVERLVVATFATAGQVCMAIKRIYVHESRYDELVGAFRTVADRVLVMGDPADAGVTVGPMVTREAVDRVAALVAEAARRGAQVVPLGRVADADLVARGWFLRPTLVLGAPRDAAVVREEQFGPTVAVLPFTDVDEVVAEANLGDLGLGASVWSADEDRAFAVARRIDAGFRFVNAHNRSGLTLRAPFGGVKRSGFGREYGDEGIREYTQTCVVHAPGAFRAGGAGVDARAYPAG
jgi:acyl-CoA reductase-like NAD-dependent aldehyde dehydrogenase